MPATMAVADALVDFKFARSTRDEKKRKPKNKGKDKQQKEDKKNNDKKKKDGGVKTFTKGGTSHKAKDKRILAFTFVMASSSKGVPKT